MIINRTILRQVDPQVRQALSLIERAVTARIPEVRLHVQNKDRKPPFTQVYLRPCRGGDQPVEKAVTRKEKANKTVISEQASAVCSQEDRLVWDSGSQLLRIRPEGTGDAAKQAKAPAKDTPKEPAPEKAEAKSDGKKG